jgi:hypothetical protein
MTVQKDKQQWLQSEDVILEREFRSGLDVIELAKRHRRSEAVIVERLHELGWINMPAVDESGSDIDEQFPNKVVQDLNQDHEHERDDEDWESDEEFLDRVRGCPKNSDEPDLTCMVDSATPENERDYGVEDDGLRS